MVARYISVREPARGGQPTIVGAANDADALVLAAEGALRSNADAVYTVYAATQSLTATVAVSAAPVSDDPMAAANLKLSAALDEASKERDARADAQKQAVEAEAKADALAARVATLEAAEGAAQARRESAVVAAAAGASGAGGGQ